jgi:hypothetical protein
VKVRNNYPKSVDEGMVIASFGRAKLIKFLNGRYELRDGSKEDRLAAHEWISMFCHDVVVKEVP